MVLFRCPTTGKSIDVGIETDQESLNSILSEQTTVICPFCTETHTFHMRDARLRDYRLAKKHFTKPLE